MWVGLVVAHVVGRGAEIVGGAFGRDVRKEKKRAAAWRAH